MLAIISPAKSLDFESAIPAIPSSENRFPEETERLANAIGNLTTKKLKAIMPVSDKLIALNRYNKLTDFWSDKIAKALAADLEQIGSDIIVNLASNEYWASVKPHSAKLPGRIIEVDFRKDSPDGPKFISFEAKRARGMMARYICENHLTDPEMLKGFDHDGYRYDAEASIENSLRFIRT